MTYQYRHTSAQVFWVESGRYLNIRCSNSVGNVWIRSLTGRTGDAGGVEALRLLLMVAGLLFWRTGFSRDGGQVASKGCRTVWCKGRRLWWQVRCCAGRL